MPGDDEAFRFGTGWQAPRRVAFVVNSDRAFVTHRAAWARALQGAGSRVRVFAPDTGYGQRIAELGLEFRPLDLGRERIGPLGAALAAVKIFWLLVIFRPRLVFLIQTAAYTLGWPAALLLPRARFVRVAGGIGRALTLEGWRGARALRALMRAGRRLPNVFTLFQLTSDYDRFVRARLTHEKRSWVVPGTGIDTAQWTPSNDRPDPPVVMFASRIFAEKGIREFVQLAESFSEYPARFVVVGAPDPGVSSSIDPVELTNWAKEGCLEWWGDRDDMVAALRRATILVFPSTHPEGTPKVLIEAAACGVPAIAFDQPGCRAVIVDEVTGWLVDPAESSAGLAEVLRSLLDKPRTIEEAGRAARDRAIQLFSTEVVLSGIFNNLGHISLARRDESDGD